MDQVTFGLKLLRPTPLPPETFKAFIRQRGWRMADVAARWNVRPETLSRVAADPQRETRWDDAVRALPFLVTRERAAATAARLFLNPPQRRRGPKVQTDAGERAPTDPDARLPPPWDEETATEEKAYASLPDGLRYQGYVGMGSELAVVTEIGSFAQEGAVLLVVDTRLGIGADGEAQEEYLCESAQGATLWLKPDQMNDWIVFTGKTRQGF